MRTRCRAERCRVVQIRALRQRPVPRLVEVRFDRMPSHEVRDLGHRRFRECGRGDPRTRIVEPGHRVRSVASESDGGARFQRERDDMGRWTGLRASSSASVETLMFGRAVGGARDRPSVRDERRCFVLRASDFRFLPRVPPQVHTIPWVDGNVPVAMVVCPGHVTVSKVRIVDLPEPCATLTSR